MLRVLFRVRKLRKPLARSERVFALRNQLGNGPIVQVSASLFMANEAPTVLALDLLTDSGCFQAESYVWEMM